MPGKDRIGVEAKFPVAILDARAARRGLASIVRRDGDRNMPAFTFRFDARRGPERDFVHAAGRAVLELHRGDLRGGGGEAHRS